MRFSSKLLLLTIVFTAVFSLAQDAANSAAPTTAKPSKATVYIYRYKQFVGSALSPSVFCDGNQLARMDNGRYFTASVEPGKHTFTSNDQQSGIDLDLKAGEQYFIRVEIAAGMMKGHGRLILMSPEQGGYELKSNKLKPLDENKVANKDIVSVGDAHLQNTALEEGKK